MSRDPGSPTAEPSPESGHRPFVKFQPHGFAPRGRLEDRHATYSSQTSSPDHNIPTEHGMPTRTSIWRSSILRMLVAAVPTRYLNTKETRKTTAHSQALLTSMVWPRSDLSLHNSILSNPAPGGVALGGQIGQADTEATAQSLWMEPCVPGIIGFSVDLLQLLGWSRR